MEPAPPPSMARPVRANRRAILDLARRHGASKIMVFGSVARGEAREACDIDFLVTFEPERSLLDLIALQQDLKDPLGVKVDVVSRGDLSPYIRDAVLREAVPV